jgi:hypothetical protein
LNLIKNIKYIIIKFKLSLCYHKQKLRLCITFKIDFISSFHDLIEYKLEDFILEKIYLKVFENIYIKLIISNHYNTLVKDVIVLFINIKLLF